MSTGGWLPGVPKQQGWWWFRKVDAPETQRPGFVAADGMVHLWGENWNWQQHLGKVEHWPYPLILPGIVHEDSPLGTAVVDKVGFPWREDLRRELGRVIAHEMAVAACSMALYAHHKNSKERATALHDRLAGSCPRPTPQELTRLLQHETDTWMHKADKSVAYAYIRLAMENYGDEAREMLGGGRGQDAEGGAVGGNTPAAGR